jgi:hypothetical protein
MACADGAGTVQLPQLWDELEDFWSCVPMDSACHYLEALDE